MAVAAEVAVREWINSKTDLVGMGNPLALGAFLIEQASPADGAYAVIARSSEGVTRVVSEPAPGVGVARMQCLVYAGTEEASEPAAAALRRAFESLSGCPEPCGDTGVWALVTENLIGPIFVPHQGDTGEIYAFQVDADFLLRDDTV